MSFVSVEESRRCFYVEANANDIVILRNGIRDMVHDAIARALQTVGNWYELVGLIFNPAKAQLMLFSETKRYHQR